MGAIHCDAFIDNRMLMYLIPFNETDIYPFHMVCTLSSFMRVAFCGHNNNSLCVSLAMTKNQEEQKTKRNGTQISHIFLIVSIAQRALRLFFLSLSFLSLLFTMQRFRILSNDFLFAKHKQLASHLQFHFISFALKYELLFGIPMYVNVLHMMCGHSKMFAFSVVCEICSLTLLLFQFKPNSSLKSKAMNQSNTMANGQFNEDDARCG